VTKILCVGDIHVMDRPPVNATESYTDDIIEMLRWTIDYAAQAGIPTIIWAGDVFHHKAPTRTSHALVQRMIDVVLYGISKGIEMICATGNHDISNDRLESLDRQPLGTLQKAGLRLLDGWHEELPLFVVPWRQDWTTNEDAALEAFDRWQGAGGVGEGPEFQVVDVSKALAVTHAPIYPPGEAEKQMFELVPTMGPKGISAAMGDTGFLYYGHIHEDHGIFEVEGVTYANMGAISRGSLHEYNLEREIKVAVWMDDEEETLLMPDGTETTLLGEPGFIVVPVPHKPAAEVFKLEQAAEAKADRLSLDSFLAEVGSSTLDISSTASVINAIQARPDVSDGVKRRAIAILEAQE